MPTQFTKIIALLQIFLLASPALPSASSQSSNGGGVQTDRPPMYWRQDVVGDKAKRKQERRERREQKKQNRDGGSPPSLLPKEGSGGSSTENLTPEGNSGPVTTPGGRNKTTYDENAKRGGRTEPPIAKEDAWGQIKSPGYKGKNGRPSPKKTYWIPICFFIDPNAPKNPNEMLKTVIDNFAACDVAVLPIIRTLGAYPREPDSFNQLAKQKCDANQAFQVEGSAVQGHVNSINMADLMCAGNDEEKKKKTDVAGCSEVGNKSGGSSSSQGGLSGVGKRGKGGEPAASIVDLGGQGASTHELGHSVGHPSLGGDYLVNTGDGEAKNRKEKAPQAGLGLEAQTKGGGEGGQASGGPEGEGASGGFTPFGCASIQGGANLNDRGVPYYPNKTKYYKHPHRAQWINLYDGKSLFRGTPRIAVNKQPHGGRALDQRRNPASTSPVQKEIRVENPFEGPPRTATIEELEDLEHRRKGKPSTPNPDDILRASGNSETDGPGGSQKAGDIPVKSARKRNSLVVDETAERENPDGTPSTPKNSLDGSAKGTNKLTYDESATRGGGGSSGGNALLSSGASGTPPDGTSADGVVSKRENTLEPLAENGAGFSSAIDPDPKSESKEGPDLQTDEMFAAVGKKSRANEGRQGRRQPGQSSALRKSTVNTEIFAKPTGN